jgi:L-ascorbate metabolism protein UlaG (beta-lactamase superfamily)
MSRFSNLDPFDAPGPLSLLRWKLGPRRPDRRTPFTTPKVAPDRARIEGPSASLTWLGHASFLLRLGGLAVVTDPIFAPRVGLATRNVAPGLLADELPAIDVVTISHAHFDHLDLPSLLAIDARTRALRGRPPLYLVPTGVGRYLAAARLGPSVERGWWESHRVGDLTCTLVPQQHWSMRTPFDRDTALWGGWVVRGPEGTAYHAGDTGFFSHFGAIGARVGPIDWAMLPIGAYDPRWMMQAQHMSAEEAGRAFVATGARTLVAMHWGTFQLTDEPLSEPPERLSRWWDEEGPGVGERERMWVLAVGETRPL